MYLFVNDKFICTSEASYGKAPPASSTTTSEPSWHGEHSITKISQCNVPIIPVKKGDWMSMIAEYDLQKYPQ
jgi:hypothetical protein